MDGTVAVWDPAAMLYATPPDGAEIAPVASNAKHKSAVKGLDFSLMAPTLLASASADGEVCVWDLGAAPSMTLSLSMQVRCWTADCQRVIDLTGPGLQPHGAHAAGICERRRGGLRVGPGRCAQHDPVPLHSGALLDC